MSELPPTAGLPLAWHDFTQAVFSGGSAQSDGNFMDMLAKFLELPEVDLYSSGTLCLSIAFETLKKKTGRNRVIVPAYTCPLVAIAAHAAGVEIVLCDTKANCTDMDETVLESICDHSIAAVVPTDIAGLPSNIAAILPIAKASGAYVVQDAAQALGARLDDKPVGAYADISIFSLAIGKGLSLYDGGIMATEDGDLRKELRRVAATRISRQAQLNAVRICEFVGLIFLYNPTALSWVYGKGRRKWLKEGDLIRAVGEHFDLDIPSYEFDEFRKRVGANAFQRLPAFIQANRSRALSRRATIQSALGLDVLGERQGAEGSWPFLLLLADSENQRDAIMKKLWHTGLGVTRLFIHELSGYDYLRKIIPLQNTPNAREFASRSFSITNSHWLSDNEFGEIMQALKSTVDAKCNV